MKIDGDPMKPLAWLRLVVATMLAMGALCPPQALAQVPARFYWKTLSGANAVPLIVESMSGNTNPFDPAHTVTPGADFDATLALAGYARTFSLFDRAAMAAILAAHGANLGRRHGGRQDVQPVGQRLRRPDARVQHQSHRPAGAEEHPRRPALRAGILARPARRPGAADRRVRQRPVAEHRPEPLVWAPGRAHRLAARRLGAGPAHDPGIPARRVVLRRQQRLCRADDGDRSACSSWTRT